MTLDNNQPILLHVDSGFADRLGSSLIKATDGDPFTVAEVLPVLEEYVSFQGYYRLGRGGENLIELKRIKDSEVRVFHFQKQYNLQ